MTTETSEQPASSSRETTRDAIELRQFMADHLFHEAQKFFGLGPKHHSYLEGVVERWFDDSKNYDGRWARLDSRIPATGKVLDMASGCGTFVLHGLRNGRDVWGVEPEGWKREYFQRKLALLGLPAEMSSRVVSSLGEKLPFADASFDAAMSYQTLEHVTDVGACVEELLRVVKAGGVLHLCAPDYRSFYEPHYRVPFLPTMNRRLASSYLSLLGRPSLGLEHLNWVTEPSLLALLESVQHKYPWKRLATEATGRGPILARFPPSARLDQVSRGVRKVIKVGQALSSLRRDGLTNAVIDLWIVKG